MIEKVNAIILSSSSYLENDLLLQVYTKEYGLLGIIIKGANKVNSKRKSLCLVYSKIEYTIDIKPYKTLYIPKDIQLLDNHKHILFDMTLASVSAVICELTYKSSINNELYNLLEYSLLKINKDNCLLVLATYIKKLIVYNGLNPNLDNCIHCHNEITCWFSYQDGSLLCHNCTNNILEDYLIDNLKKLFSTNDIVIVDLKLIDIIINYYLYHTNIKLNSYDIMKVII